MKVLLEVERRIDFYERWTDPRRVLPARVDLPAL
jgi:hypothetical protein